MYRLSLVLLALLVAAGADTIACGRMRMFRHRSACCPTYFQPAVPMEPTEPEPPTPDDATPLSAAEQAQLDQLLDAYKKSGAYDEKGLRDFAAYFRSLSPEDRAKEKAPEEPAAKALTKDEEKMLKAILENYKKNKIYDEKGLKEYEKFYREGATPKERISDYKELEKEGTQVDAPAKFLVHLPANARLTVDGNATSSTSSLRLFETPSLSARAVNLYELKATMERDGRRVSVTRLIRVVPGQTTEVTLEIPASHNPQIARK